MLPWNNGFCPDLRSKGRRDDSAIRMHWYGMDDESRMCLPLRHHAMETFSQSLALRDRNPPFDPSHKGPVGQRFYGFSYVVSLNKLFIKLLCWQCFNMWHSCYHWRCTQQRGVINRLTAYTDLYIPLLLNFFDIAYGVAWKMQHRELGNALPLPNQNMVLNSVYEYENMQNLW